MANFDETPTVPKLNCLYINPTQYCNLSCKHCWLSPPNKSELTGEEGELSMDEIIGVVKEAVKLGMSAIKLTGGEPLLRKDLAQLLEFCHSKDVDIDIETNGTLITKEVAQLFKRVNMGHISISLDSAQASVHDYFRGKKGAFDESIRGIKNLQAEGFSPQTIISLYKENLEGFKPFLHFMKELGIRDVKVNTITCIGRGEEILNAEKAPTLEEIIDFSERLEGYAKDFEGKIYLDVPIAFKTLEEIKYRGCGRCHIKNILGLLPNGDVSMCGIGIVDEELLFGNVKEDPAVLSEIWHNNPVLKKIRTDIPSKIEGVCQICVFNKTCLGNCRAEVYHNTNCKSKETFCKLWLTEMI